MNRIFHVLYSLLGMAQLASWNVYSKIIPFFMQQFGNNGVDDILSTKLSKSISGAMSTSYTLGVLVTQVGLLIYPLDDLFMSLSTKLIGSMIFQAIVMFVSMIVPTSLIFPLDGIGLFTIILIITIIAGVNNAIMVRGLFSLIGRSDPVLTPSFGVGQGICGLFFSSATLFAVLVTNASDQVSKMQAVVFFSFGISLIIMALVVYVRCLKRYPQLQQWLSGHPCAHPVEFQEISSLTSDDNAASNVTISTFVDIHNPTKSLDSELNFHPKSLDLKYTEIAKVSKKPSQFMDAIIVYRHIWWFVMGTMLSIGTTVSFIATFMVSPRVSASIGGPNSRFVTSYYRPFVFLLYDSSEVVGRAWNRIPSQIPTKTDRIFKKMTKLLPIVRLIVLTPLFLFFSPVQARYSISSIKLTAIPLGVNDFMYALAIFLTGVTNGWCLNMLFVYAQQASSLIPETKGMIEKFGVIPDEDQNPGEDNSEGCLSSDTGRINLNMEQTASMVQIEQIRSRSLSACGTLMGVFLATGLLLGSLSVFLWNLILPL